MVNPQDSNLTQEDSIMQTPSNEGVKFSPYECGNNCPQRTTRDIRQCLLKTEKQGSFKSKADFNFITNIILDDIDDDDTSKFFDVLIYKEPIDPCVVDG
ncbi:hypothetical protein Lal_00033746 [Lupinus albus]|nr:hypothetical protein Lal_00033746 [Lupinus albus]